MAVTDAAVRDDVFTFARQPAACPTHEFGHTLSPAALPSAFLYCSPLPIVNVPFRLKIRVTA